MRYIRQYNTQAKPVKWKHFDPSRRITPDSIVTVHQSHTTATNVRSCSRRFRPYSMFDDDFGGLPRSLGRISPSKPADVLAAELRKRIRTGEWPGGLALSTERELASQSGLSRTSVREALWMLGVDGLIEIRPGRNGGAKVCRSSGHELKRQLDLFIWSRNITF